MRRVVAAALLAGFAAACGGGFEVEPLNAPWDGAAGGVADPALAADGTDALAAWVAEEADGWALWFARSADGGTSWSEPARVAGEGRVHPHAEASPRIVAAPGGRVAIAWTSSIPVEGRRFPASELWVATSSDGGDTWSAPARVHATDGPPVSHTFHGAVREGDDGLVVAWLDGRGMDVADTTDPSAVWMARSPDWGATWEAERPLWPAACPCCRVDLARTRGGELLAAWRHHFEGDVRDIVAAPLPAAGAAPAEPVRVHADEWIYPACPHAGPALAVGGDGRAHVAWYTGAQGVAGVRHAVAGDVGEGFGAPLYLAREEQYPVAHVAMEATDDGGAVVAWDVGPTGEREVVVARVAPDGAETSRTVIGGSAGADHPRLTRVGERWLVAWTVPGDVPVSRLARVSGGS